MNAVKLYSLTVLFFIASVFLNLNMGELGSVFTNPLEILDINTGIGKVFFDLRLPRVINAIIAGTALSAAGYLFQAILENPLADPYTLGISSGAALGSVLFKALSLSIGGFLAFGFDALFSFTGAALTSLILFSIAKKSPTSSKKSTMILTGVILAFFFSSIVSLILNISGMTLLASSMNWLLGSLTISETYLSKIALPVILILWFFAWLESYRIDFIQQGEELAHSAGINLRKTRLRLFIIASALTAVSVSIVGSVGFIGLIIPHASRLIYKKPSKIILPMSALLGSGFLLICDSLGRILFTDIEVPVGVITSFFGAPAFLYLMLKDSSSFKWGNEND